MNRKFTQQLFTVFLALMMCFSITSVKAVMTRATLTGFNQDVIANGLGSPTVTSTAAFDNVNYCLVAHSYQATVSAPPPTYSLVDSAIIWSQNSSTPTLSWQLASYSSNNSLKLTTLNSTGTLTFVNQTLKGDIYLLVGAGDASPYISGDIIVHFTDNTSLNFPAQQFYDWYNSGTIAIQGIGRVARVTGLTEGSTLYPRLFQIKLTMPLANYVKSIANIQFTKTSSNGSINVLAATVDHQPCAPIFNLTATSITTTTATVGWAAATSTSGYQYVVSTSATPPSSGTSTTLTSINVTSLNVGTAYYLHVRNDCGGGVYSVWNSIPFSTSPCPTVTNDLITNNIPGTCTFSWNGSSVSGVVGYQWAITTSNQPPTTWNSTTSSSVNVTGLTPGTSYYAWVRTNCNNTTAGWTFVTFTNPYPPCGLPTSVIVSNISMHAARIVWNNGTNGDSYRYAVNTTTASPANGGITTYDTVYEATNLLPNTTYYIHLRTHCGGLNYSGWRLDSFTTAATCISSISPHVDSFFADVAYISWHRYLGALKYEYVLNNIASSPTTNGYPVLDTIVVPANLYSGTKYYIHLRVRCDTANTSEWSTDSFTTLTHCIPTNMPSVAALGPHNVTVQWQAANYAAWYEYKLSNSPNPPSVGAATSYLTYSINSLSANTTYYFHIRSYCSAGDISSWKTLQFKTEPLGINNLNNDGVNVEVYPNPVTDNLNIKLDGELKTDSKVILLDVTGKVIMEQEIHQKETTIDMSKFNPGMYILKYQDSETFGALRVIKD